MLVCGTGVSASARSARRSCDRSTYSQPCLRRLRHELARLAVDRGVDQQRAPTSCRGPRARDAPSGSATCGRRSSGRPRRGSRRTGCCRGGCRRIRRWSAFQRADRRGRLPGPPRSASRRRRCRSTPTIRSPRCRCRTRPGRGIVLKRHSCLPVLHVERADQALGVRAVPVAEPFEHRRADDDRVVHDGRRRVQADFASSRGRVCLSLPMMTPTFRSTTPLVPNDGDRLRRSSRSARRGDSRS